MAVTSLARILVAVAVVTVGCTQFTNADVQREFFEAVQSGQVEQLMSQMRPELLVEIDEPILDAWVKALNERAGAVQSITNTGLVVKQTENGRLRTTTAAVTFEKGTGTSMLSALDGRLIAFEITSDQLGSNWFQGPATTDLYQELGRTFIELFMSDEVDEAYAMCHAELQKVIDRESFGEMTKIVRSKHGAWKSVAYKDSRMEINNEGQTLLLNFDVTGDSGTGTCEIKVQFAGMKGHLVGFNFE